MGDENPDFKPKVGDAVWYDHEDDWVESTVLKVTGKTYSLEVEGVGRVDKVEKKDMLPVEYEDEEDAEGRQEEEEEEEGGDEVDEDLQQLMEGCGLAAYASDLAAAGIRSVDDLAASNDAALKAANVGSAAKRKKLLQAAQKEKGGGGGGRITVVFPAGPLGIDINQAGGRIKVTSAKGVAADQGVVVGDFLIRVGAHDVAQHLKDVPNDKKCAEVKKLVVTNPRPLEMVFDKEGSGGGDPKASDNDDASVSSKKRWSLFGKKGGKDSDAAKDAAAAAKAVATPAEEDDGGGDEFTVTFQAGSLGLSVTNDPKRDGLLCVTKAAGQAASNEVEIGDEILALNGKPCRGAKSEEFKKLIVAAGRPFDLTLKRSSGNEEEEAEAEDEAKRKKEQDAIAEARAKATADKKKQAAEEKRGQQQEEEEEEEQERRRQEEEEAAASAAAADEDEDSKKKKKDLKVGMEVWYDNGEDWVEANIVAMGAKLTLELQETGEEVADVKKEWVAPMEYEGEEGGGDEEEDGEANKGSDDEGSEDGGMNMLADLAASSSDSSVQQSSPAKTSSKKSKAAEKAATTAAASSTKKMTAAERRKQEAEKKKKENKNSKAVRKSNFEKFKAQAVDREQAKDSLHRARTARMSYAAMITYASYHAGGGAKKAAEGEKLTEQQHSTVLASKLKKARSKSVEKRGPQISEGESHYQYLMRKKREEAEEEELAKMEAREEQARLREEALQADWDYRQQLIDEHEENNGGSEEEYDD